jgi:hypothetical protein
MPKVEITGNPPLQFSEQMPITTPAVLAVLHLLTEVAFPETVAQAKSPATGRMPAD